MLFQIECFKLRSFRGLEEKNQKRPKKTSGRSADIKVPTCWHPSFLRIRSPRHKYNHNQPKCRRSLLEFQPDVAKRNEEGLKI